MLRAIWALLITSCLSALALGHSKEKKLEPCALLTAADAASIMGVPLRIVDLSKNSCMYGEYRGRGSLIKGGILDLGLSFGVKRYKDMQAADSAWRRIHQLSIRRPRMRLKHSAGLATRLICSAAVRTES
jgi:hypothetical protein